MRELTNMEKKEIQKENELIKHYRTGILLAKMRIKMIQNKPQDEELEQLMAEPIEF